MINQKFKDNWLKIINFNSKVNIVEDPGSLKEIVRIPLTPVKINAYLLYHLFELLYPRYINDQHNILDIIISDFDIENKVLAMYLYKTKKAGIHESIENLPKDLIRIKEEELLDIAEVFNKIQSTLLEKKGIKISSIRIFKRRGIDLINRLSENLEKVTFYDFLLNFFDLNQKIFEQELFFIYPESNMISFIKKNLQILNGIRLSTIFKHLNDMILPFNTSIIIDSKEIKLLLQLQKRLSHNKNSEIEFKIDMLEYLENKNPNKLMDFVSSEVNSETIFCISEEDILSILSDLFNLEVPFKKDEFKLILQKVLFGFRNFETRWDLIPKPKIYYTLVRFLIRLIGININFRKLSHWIIPELIFNLMDTYLGLNSKILFLLTNATDSKNILAMLFKIENSSIVEIIPLNIKVNQENSLKDLRLNYSTDFGYISSIIKIDRTLLQQFLNMISFKFYKLSFFGIIKLLKLFKNEKYFQIYPEIPPYKMIKKKSTYSLLKALLSILIDKHEF